MVHNWMAGAIISLIMLLTLSDALPVVSTQSESTGIGLASLDDSLDTFNQTTTIIVPRTLGDEGDPKLPEFDITGWEDLAELNCWDMLCNMSGQRVFPKQPNDQAATDAYNQSGAGRRPFQDGNVSHYGLNRISSDTQSAEDFPWRSINIAPGYSRSITGVPQRLQSIQGAAIRNGYASANVGPGDWFKITYVPPSARGRFCRALHQEPPNFSECNNPYADLFGQKNIDLREIGYVRDASQPGWAFKNAYKLAHS